MSLYYYAFLIVLMVLFNRCTSLSKVQDSDTSDYKENIDEINSNNKIYKEGTRISYDYFFIKNDDTLKCQVMPIYGQRPNFQSPSLLVDMEDTLDVDNAIGKFEIVVTGETFFREQTEITFNLFSELGNAMSFAETSTGIIENETEVWLHPLRVYHFNITEFNPFPHIKYPLKKNHTWESELTIYASPVYKEWIEFEKEIHCTSKYKIIGKENLATSLGLMECYIVEGVATTPKSQGFLTAYFNPTYGFIKLDYTNIDKSRLIIEVDTFKNVN